MNEEMITMTKKELREMLLAEFKKGYRSAVKSAARKNERSASKSVLAADMNVGGGLKYRGT